MGNVPKHMAKSRREGISSAVSVEVLDRITNVQPSLDLPNAIKRLEGANYAIQTLCRDFLGLTQDQVDLVVKYSNAGSHSHLKTMLKEWRGLK